MQCFLWIWFLVSVVSSLLLMFTRETRLLQNFYKILQNFYKILQISTNFYKLLTNFYLEFGTRKPKKWMFDTRRQVDETWGRSDRKPITLLNFSSITSVHEANKFLVDSAVSTSWILNEPSRFIRISHFSAPRFVRPVSIVIQTVPVVIT